MDSKTNSKLTMAVAAIVAVAAIGGFIATSGNNEDSASNETTNSTEQTVAEELPLGLEFNNLAPLEQGVYEGWIVRGDDKFTLGTFNTTESGEVEGNLSLGEVVPQNGDTVAVSIEPVPDTDPDPSPTIILAGEITDGSADLAFPVDLTDFSGQYILATPSDGDNTNETSGIWFVDPSDLTASLNLPDAPEGWAYEGWAVYQGAPYSTGTFTSVSGLDDFDGFTADGPFPPFPGEDFLVNLPNGIDMPFMLADGESKVVISLEPSINGVDPTGAGPAQIKPLAADIAEGAADHSLFDLTLDTSTPSGSATL